MTRKYTIPCLHSRKCCEKEGHYGECKGKAVRIQQNCSCSPQYGEGILRCAYPRGGLQRYLTYKETHLPRTPQKGPIGPLGFEGAQHRQTNTLPFRRRDPQQSPASFWITVQDLEDPAVQCRWLAGLCLCPYGGPRGGGAFL